MIQKILLLTQRHTLAVLEKWNRRGWTQWYPCFGKHLFLLGLGEHPLVFESALELKIALNTQSSGLCISSTGITGVHLHTRPSVMWNET